MKLKLQKQLYTIQPYITVYSSGHDMKILLTLDTERYISNFDIGGKLGQFGI